MVEPLIFAVTAVAVFAFGHFRGWVARGKLEREISLRQHKLRKLWGCDHDDAEWVEYWKLP